MSSKVEGHSSELGTRSSGTSYLSWSWESAKLEVGAGTDWICQDCRGFPDMKAAAFVWGIIGNAGFALFFEEDAANIEEVEELICFTSKDEDGNEVLIGITDLAEEETSFIGALTRFVFQPVPKTIIIKFCWN